MFKENEHDYILNTVVDALRRTLHATLGSEPSISVRPAGSPAASAVREHGAAMTLRWNGVMHTFAVVLKPSVTPATVARLASSADPSSVFVVTSRLTPAVMAACRQFGIACADADGNAFIRTDGGAVDIERRPPTASRRLQPTARATRLASRAGLQVVFVLLAGEALRNETVRVLSTAANVSVGTAAGVLRELEHERYLTIGSTGRSLHRGAELLDVWADGYRHRLFDRLRWRTFTAAEPAWWKAHRRRPPAGQWGGETAVWAAGGELRPARGILYVDAIPTDLIRTHRMAPDDEPNATVEFRRRFWDVPAWNTDAAVPAALIYADLLADGDPRLVEAAARMRNENDDLRRLG